MAYKSKFLQELDKQGKIPSNIPIKDNVNYTPMRSPTDPTFPEQIQQYSKHVLSSNFPLSVKPATTGTGKYSQLFISPTVKSGIDSFIKSADVGFADNGAYGNQAVKNARANGLDDLADSLQKQFDERERARQLGEWEADRSVDDLRQKQAAEQADLNALMDQRDLFIGMMAGGGQLTDEQQAELLKIEAAIKNAWDNVKSYDMRAETKYTNDWMERNLAEIRQAEQEMWDPQDRQRHLDRLLSVSLPEADLSNPTAIARREREIDVLKTDLLGRIREATHNPVTKEALVKELLEHGYSRKQISSWFDYAEQLENADFMVDYEEKWKEKGADMRAGQAIRRSTVNSLLGGLGAIGVWGQKVENAITGKDTPLDFNSPLMRPSVKAQAIREGKSEDIEKRTEGWIGSDTAFGNLYSGAFNLGASMADSAAIAGLTALGVPAWAGSLALGSSAASSAMRAAEERGLPGDKALLLGTISGLAEMFFEKYSVESLLNNIDSPETIRQLLKQAAIQGGIESTEEGFTTIVNAAADMLISGNLSEYEVAKRNYIASGMSEEAAAKQASSDWLLGLTTDLVGGFISGGTMTAVPGSIKLAINSKNANRSSTTPTQNTMDSQVAAAMADMKTPDQRIAEALGGMRNPMENKTALFNMTGADITPSSEALSQNAKTVVSMNSVFDIPAERLQNSGKDIKEVYDEYFKAWGYNIHSDVLGDIAVKKASIRSEFYHGNTAEKIASIEAIPSVIKQGKIVDWFEKQKGLLRITVAAPIKIGDTPYYMGVMLQRDNQNQRLYIHDVILDEETSASTQEHLSTKGPYDENKSLSISSILRKALDVNSENVGDMGAKTSQFPHEVVKSQTNAINNQRDIHVVPEEYQTEYAHTRVSEGENLHSAKLRVEQDRKGEQDYLSNKTQWNGEDYDTAMLILDDLAKTAREQGTEDAWEDYAAWEKVIRKDDHEAGSALQARAKWARRTGSKIIQLASEYLETARENTDVAEIMNSVADYATQYDAARDTHDVDALKEIIKNTSATRRTGTLRKNQLSKQMNWALDRIANYAKAELNNGETGPFYEFLENFAASGIEAIATDKQKTDIGKAITTYQRMAMLSKISTVMRNLVNNGILDPVDGLSNNVSAVIDSAISSITGTRSVAFEKLTSKEKQQGSLDGLAMAMLSVGLDVNSDGVSGKYQTNSNRTWHMSNNLFSKFMSQWEKYMGYAMVATDEFSKGGIKAEVQRGIDKLYEQGKIKDDTLRNAGEEMAKYRTLQKEGTMSKVTTGIRDVINKASREATGRMTDGKLELDAGNLLVPFAQVPANVPGVVADYSPIGLAKGIVKLAKVFIDAKRGTLTAAQQASAVRDVGRGLTGSAMIACAAGLSSLGLIRVHNPGGTEEDKNKSADKKASGATGTQWNLSATVRALSGKSAEWQDGDTMMSIAFLEPINAFLTAGALLAEAEEMTGKEFASASFAAMLDAYLELPMFQTAKSTVDAFRYSNADSTGGKAIDALEQAGANLVTGFIPNPVKGIAQGFDPYQRDLYSGDTFGERVRDQFLGVFNRDALPIKQDVYGNDIKNDNRFLNFMNSNILPGAITTYKETDLQKALRDLEKETGTTAGYLSKDAPTSVDTERGNVELTDEQKKQFTTDRGNIYEVASSALENSDLFKGLPANIQQQTYGYAEKYATQTAKENLNIGFKPDDIAADLDNPTSQELLDALLLKTFNSMAGNTKVYGDKYQGYADMLRVDTINDQIALDLISKTRREVYENTLRSAGVSVQQWLDVLSVANRKQGNYVGNKPTKQQREDAWAHIDKMNLTDKQRAALETAVGQVFGYVIVKDATRK